jgi:replicative DNA helicase
MLELHEVGTPIDQVTIIDAIKGQDKEADVQRSYLVELHDAAPSPFNARRYAEIVRNKAILRELSQAAHEIQHEVESPSGPAWSLLDDSVQRIQNLAERRARSNLVTGAEASKLAIDQLIDMTGAEGARDHWVKTGLADLDDKTGGFGNGELVIIAGRTSQGKTALALQIAYNVAFEFELPVLFFSLEQGRIEIGHRINSMRTGIDGYKFRQPKEITQYDAELLHQTGQFFHGKPLFIDDKRGQTVRQIAPIARQFKRKHGLRLLIVDYLQLLQFPSGKGGWVARQEQVAAITRELKCLAKELECPLVALAQLNREVEQRADKKPQLSDLRESGSIEQDADTAILLYPPNDEDLKLHPEMSGTICLIIAKQRNGPIGTVTVLFDKKTGRIGNFCWDGIEPRSFCRPS